MTSDSKEFQVGLNTYPAWLYPAEVQLPLDETTAHTELSGDAVPVSLRVYAQLAQLLYGLDTLLKSRPDLVKWWSSAQAQSIQNIDILDRERTGLPHRWFKLENGQSDDDMIAAWNAGLPYFACYLGRYDTVEWATINVTLLAFLSPGLSAFAKQTSSQSQAQFVSQGPLDPRNLLVNLRAASVALRNTVKQMLENYIRRDRMTLRPENPDVYLLQQSRRERDQLQVKFAHYEIEFTRSFRRLADFFLHERGIDPMELNDYSKGNMVLYLPVTTHMLPGSSLVTAPENSQRPFAGVFGALACTGRAVYKYITEYSIQARKLAATLHHSIQRTTQRLDREMKRPALLSRLVYIPTGEYLDTILSIKLEEVSSETVHIYVVYRLDAMVSAVATVMAFDNYMRTKMAIGILDESILVASKKLLNDAADRLVSLCIFLQENMLTEGDADYVQLTSQAIADIALEMDSVGVDLFNTLWKQLDSYQGVAPYSYKQKEFTTDFYLWLRSLTPIGVVSGLADVKDVVKTRAIMEMK